MLRGWMARGLAVLLTVGFLVGATISTANAFTDITITKRARLSEPYRSSVTLREFRHSPHGRWIAWRESHRVCAAVSPSGTYRGKWQMTRSLWRSYGGHQFALFANHATCWEQDIVARRVWVAQWWWPWGG